MPTIKEFNVLVEDRPGTLGKLCRALADRGVNIVAFETFETTFRFIVDNPTTAKTALDNEKISYTEAEVAQVKLPNRQGELARAASRLGEATLTSTTATAGLRQGRMRLW